MSKYRRPQEGAYHIQPGQRLTWFGVPCPDCQAPQIQFCPLCGVNLNAQAGHARMIATHKGVDLYIMLCHPCAYRLAAGEVLPWPEYNTRDHTEPIADGKAP